MRYKIHCIIAIVFFFMILILLYRFDAVNSFLAFIISNLIIVLFLRKFNYLYVIYMLFICYLYVKCFISKKEGKSPSQDFI